MEYSVVYSKRKTIAICVNVKGEVIVKSPIYLDRISISNFVAEKKEWIEKARNKVLNAIKNKMVIDEVKENELKKKAIELIDKKVELYSKIIGVNPKKIVIGNAKSYWGYCDSRNNINFSWRLMLASDRAIDYVVVHELTHIKHHNHSKEFWNEVGSVIPDYKVFRNELKELSKKL